VTAVPGSEEKLEFCRSIGIDHVVSRRSATFADDIHEATGGHGIDLIYDLVGGDTASAAIETLDGFQQRLAVCTALCQA
jgi:NADPH2:quinone reductase